MSKQSYLIISAALFAGSALFVSGQNAWSQTKNENSKIVAADSDVSDFYSSEQLQSDFKQAEVVVYVLVKERELVNVIGKGDCEGDKGTGYCLYRLKGDVKEVFKGKVSKKAIEFYTSPDADYPKKVLLGEKVVFLKWADNYPDKKRSLGAIENSTREIEHKILENMRKIAKKKI
jgi:hypothetical protein